MQATRQPRASAPEGPGKWRQATSGPWPAPSPREVRGVSRQPQAAHVSVAPSSRRTARPIRSLGGRSARAGEPRPSHGSKLANDRSMDITLPWLGAGRPDRTLVSRPGAPGGGAWARPGPIASCGRAGASAEALEPASSSRTERRREGARGQCRARRKWVANPARRRARDDVGARPSRSRSAGRRPGAGQELPILDGLVTALAGLLILSRSNASW